MTAGRPIVLINSGAYIHQELSAEFGSLPPAFLPVGLHRLYELQAQTLRPCGGDLYLTLPESFNIPEWDAQRLAELNFTVLTTPDYLDLGSALLYALGGLDISERRLRVLHGDTLLDGIDFEADDMVAVAHGGDGYRWAQVEIEGDTVRSVARPDRHGDAAAGPRLCGYFAFSRVSQLAGRLALSQGDFYQALNRYADAGQLSVATPGAWMDFGHVQTYFRSRRIVTTARVFNSLEITETRVRKRSRAAEAKIRAEARWLRDVPPAMAPFCARVLDDGDDANGYYYDTEYEYMPTLAELYVFGQLSGSAWSRVLQSCGQFLEASVVAGSGADARGQLQALVIEKTRERLHQHAAAIGLDLKAPNRLGGRPAPSLRACLDDIAVIVNSSGAIPSIMHGDFCFSNILYSFRTGRVRVIDPRGVTEQGEFSLLGDVRYDLAKIMHSICGRYDLIVAGLYKGGRTGQAEFELEFPEDPWRGRLEELAAGMHMGGVPLSSDVVWASMISLFLSMAPLHADRPDRQAAFIANALRLRLALDGISS